MKKDLLEILSIKKNDIIAITGTGGKTTLMMKLAQELKKQGSVLITTSTKIGIPKESQVDYVYDSFSNYQTKNYKNKIVALGEKIAGKNKFSQIKEEDLQKIQKDFDYIIIEADGSKNLPLKFWKDYEPVIYKITTKTVAVFSTKTIGRKISEDFIYNYEDFKKYLAQEKIDKEVFLKLIRSKPGPFGDFNKEKYVFFNQADTEEEKNKVREIIKYLKQKEKEIKYFYGTILMEDYYED